MSVKRVDTVGELKELIADLKNDAPLAMYELSTGSLDHGMEFELVDDQVHEALFDQAENAIPLGTLLLEYEFSD